jgi:hypothetical protein
MTASPRFDQIVVGRVSTVNEKGIRIDGEEGWFNYSKFAVGLVAPEKGEEVAVTLDKGGFVRHIGPALGAAPMPPRSVPVAPQQPAGDRERTITRLAVLKAAAEYSASKPSSSSADVLKIAASWERWITREQETTYDLDAADDDAAF